MNTNVFSNGTNYELLNSPYRMKSNKIFVTGLSSIDNFSRKYEIIVSILKIGHTSLT